jgi:hypothetical protein
MSDTISTVDNLSKFLRENPSIFLLFLLLDAHHMKEWQQQREQVRLRLVAEFSSAPLYQARAAKDPEYWNTFSIGRVR